MLSLIFSFLFLALGRITFADKTLNWDIEWMNAAPDGFMRPVIGINGQFPCPTLELTLGETVTIHVNNKLGNESTGIHWHGITQKGTYQMDGPSAVTQCPVPPGSSFTYKWTANQVGTYWYHAHNMGQYPDGIRGALIIHDPQAPYINEVEEEFLVTVSDWYHTEMPYIIHEYQAPGESRSEPVPDNITMNDGGNVQFNVVPGKTYLLRFINIGAFPSFFVNIKGLQMTVVEIDGVYTQRNTIDTFYVGAAMRYTVLVTIPEDATDNIGILALLDTSMFEGQQYHGAPWAMGYLVVDSSKPMPGSHRPVMPPSDDLGFYPLDNEPLLGPVTKQIVINFGFTEVEGVPRALVNDVTYVNPKVPTLYTALSVGKENSRDMRVYGVNSNPILVNYNDIVEIVINNYDNAGHPWHIHGRQFQVVARSQGGHLPNGQYDATSATLPQYPMRRDTVGVRGLGYTVVRYRADNPGAHLIHCHIEWHVEAGLSATLIEAPEMINERIPLGPKMNCLKQGMPFAGNAAGNLFQPFNLKGANTEFDTDNWGAIYSKRDRAFLAKRLAQRVFEKRNEKYLEDNVVVKRDAAPVAESLVEYERREGGLIKGGGWGGVITGH